MTSTHVGAELRDALGKQTLGNGLQHEHELRRVPLETPDVNRYASKMKQSSKRPGRPRFLISESLKEAAMIEQVDGASTESECLGESRRRRQSFQQDRSNPTQAECAGQHQACGSCADYDDIFDHPRAPLKEPATAQAAPVSVDDARSAVHSNRSAGAAATRGNHTSSVKPLIMLASRTAARRGMTPASMATPAATCAAPVMYAIAARSGSQPGTSAAVS